MVTDPYNNLVASQDGVAPLGPLLSFKSAAALQQEEDAQAAEQAAIEDAAADSPMISSLAGYIDDCWAKALRAKFKVEQQMLKNMRQRNGIYEQDIWSQIQEMGGSDIYVLLTATKCRAAEAWINDVLRPMGDKLFVLQPTPLADLPPDIVETIRAETEAVAQEVINQCVQFQQFINPQIMHELLREYLEERRDKELEKIQEEAEERSERMTKVIEDQLKEGRWYESFWEVVSDIVTHKGAILKGPVIRNQKVKKWVKGADGKARMEVQYELVPQFDRVSPFDLYPAPDSRHPDDGYLIQRHQLTRSELQALIGVPGYNEKNIRLALKDYAHGYRTILAVDTQRNLMEFSGETIQQTMGEKIEAREFWGSVQGKMLIDWGLSDNIDPEMDYEINAWKVGNYVIKAILNPDILGRKPYSVDSYERIPGSFWGKGVPELMADNQDLCNSLARAISNNAQVASGPQVEVNTDRCTADNEDLYPWKVWHGNNATMQEAPAVRFFQPQIIVEQLLRVFEFFAAQSEDQTGIPRWAYGQTNLGGAGSTSSGLSMLMTHASRNIKEVINHLDLMTSKCIERLYDYNMAYHPDENIKGDCNVVARGSSVLLAKEQKTVRLNEFLQQTLNPVDQQIMGIDGRAKLLKEVTKALELDDDIIPDKEGLEKLVEKIQATQQQLMAAGQNPGETAGMVPPANPQTVDNAGNAAGGADMQKAGQAPQTAPNPGEPGTGIRR